MSPMTTLPGPPGMAIGDAGACANNGREAMPTLASPALHAASKKTDRKTNNRTSAEQMTVEYFTLSPFWNRELKRLIKRLDGSKKVSLPIHFTILLWKSCTKRLQLLNADLPYIKADVSCYQK